MIRPRTRERRGGVARPTTPSQLLLSISGCWLLLLLAAPGIAWPRAQVRRFAVAVESSSSVVREVKSTCGVEACTTYLLVEKVSQEEAETRAAQGEGIEIRSSSPAPAAAKVSLEGAETTKELWRVRTPRSSGQASSVSRLFSLVPSDGGRLRLCESSSRAEPFLMFQARGSVHFVDPHREQDEPLRGGTRLGSETWSAPAIPWHPDCSELLLVEPGLARIVWLAGDGAVRSVLSETRFRTALSVSRNGAGLTLESSPLTPIRSSQARQQPRLLALGPRQYDHLRLESIVFDADLSTGSDLLENTATETGLIESEESTVRRYWSRLPAQEEILESRYVDVDGSLLLLVVTKEAQKVGILERKKIRLFDLQSDRTRAGSAPIFEVISASRLWQKLDIVWMDMTGDGVTDLIAIQPEGLSGATLVVDVYEGLGKGRFSIRKSRSDVGSGQEWWTLGDDWNGDSVGDLITLDGDTLGFYWGLRPAAASTKRLKSAQIGWSSERQCRLQLNSGDLNSVAIESMGGGGPVSSRRAWFDPGVGVLIGPSSGSGFIVEVLHTGNEGNTGGSPAC